MTQKILAIAPHPDDETLGCGGTLLRHVAQGDEVHWLIVTSMHVANGFSDAAITARDEEIKKIAAGYGFSSVHRAGLPTTMLDTLPMGEVVGAIASVVKAVQPHTLYIPYRGDAHSDHAVVFDASTACAKGFRYPSVKRVLAYEALSETEFGLRPEDGGFRPNHFVDISAYAQKKVELMKLYAGEMAPFPFPRSEEAMWALMRLRGSTAGVQAAEAFMLLREIV